MRLFSKVREGTAFVVGSQNSKVDSVQPVVRQQFISDSAVEAQASTELSSAVMGVFGCVVSSLHVCSTPCCRNSAWHGTCYCAKF